jgi:hypothetical protein
MKEEKLYRIRRRRDGLFSTGGHYPRWTKTGKSWTKIGYLRRHIAEVSATRSQMIYDECDVIEYTMTENDDWPMSVEIDGAKLKQQKKIEAERKKHQKWAAEKQEREENAEKQKLRELLDKYGPLTPKG